MMFSSHSARTAVADNFVSELWSLLMRGRGDALDGVQRCSDHDESSELAGSGAQLCWHTLWHNQFRWNNVGLHLAADCCIFYWERGLSVFFEFQIHHLFLSQAPLEYQNIHNLIIHFYAFRAPFQRGSTSFGSALLHTLFRQSSSFCWERALYRNGMTSKTVNRTPSWLLSQL